MAEFDEGGYLVNWQEWDRSVALKLASCEGIKDLTGDHWEVLLFIRSYYKDFGAIPSVRKICAGTRMNSLEMYRLFPSGPVRSACRIAGMPRQYGCD